MEKNEHTIPERKSLVAVVGNANLSLGSKRLSVAEELGCRLVDADYRIMCGGMGGVMEAVCKGALQSPAYSTGTTIAVVPGDSTSQANAYAGIVIPTGLGFARNSIIGHADAIVGIGGGAGTLSEMAYGWMFERMVIGMRLGGWSERLAGRPLDERVRFPGFEDDRVWGADTANEVVDLLEHWLPVYRSKTII